MPKFPLPDISSLQLIAQSMRASRQTRTDETLASQAVQANTALQMQGRELQFRETQRQGEIDLRAGEMATREQERSEDKAHAFALLGRRQDFAREQQLEDMAFKYQKAGLAGRVAGSGTSPRLPGSQSFRSRSTAPPRTFTGPGGQVRPVQPVVGGITREMLPQLFPNPVRQRLAQDLWDRGEHDQVRIMADKTAGLNDPENEIRDLDRTVRMIQSEISDMQEAANFGEIDAEGLNGLIMLRNLNMARRVELMEQKIIMTSPDAKQAIHDINDVPSPEREAAVAEVYKLFDKSIANRDAEFEARPDFLYHMAGMLRAQGYDIQLMAISRQATPPSVPPPPEQAQTPGPVDLSARADAMKEDEAHKYDVGDFNRDGLVGPPPNPTLPVGVSPVGIGGRLALEGIAGSYDWAKYHGLQAAGRIDRYGDVVGETIATPLKAWWESGQRDWRYIFKGE